MSEKKTSSFDDLANWASNFAGSPLAFHGALLTIIVWSVTFFLFGNLEEWEIMLSLFTNIITFLMVFLIQKAQNKDSKAIQIKLNELIAAHEKASNRIVDIEDLTEKELDKLHRYYEKLSDLAEKDDDLHTSHSIDAAKDNNDLSKRNQQIYKEIEQENK